MPRRARSSAPLVDRAALRPPRLDLAIAAALTAAALALHVVVLRHAGGLWRDEVQILNISTSPTFAEQWDLNAHDTFPLLWQLVLRGWSALGLASDAGLRALGVIVGVATLGMLWYAVRQFRVRTPLVSLLLCALSPAVVVFGDSVRGYGFGLMWLLFMLGRLGRFVLAPTRQNAIWAGIATLLAVQSFYFSVVLFVVIGGVALVMFARRGQWRPAGQLLAVGCIAAASMLPYLDVLGRQREWFAFIQADVTPGKLWNSLVDAVNLSGPVTIWVWGALLALAVDAAFVHAVTPRPGPDDEKQVRRQFAGAIAVAGAAAYVLFLLWHRHPTHAWYYVGLFGFEAVAIDAAIADVLASSRRIRIGSCAAAAGLAVVVLTSAWPAAERRLTNVDQIAASLNDAVAAEDLVVVNPWWFGVSFARYYRGPAPWVAVPDLGPLRVQRFDLLLQKIHDPQPIAPVIARMAETLHAGHKVWIAGDLAPLAPGEDPGMAPPPPVGPERQEPYKTVWARQVTAFLLLHTTSRSIVEAGPQAVNDFETLSLFVAQGWQ